MREKWFLTMIFNLHFPACKWGGASLVFRLPLLSPCPWPVLLLGFYLLLTDSLESVRYLESTPMSVTHQGMRVSFNFHKWEEDSFMSYGALSMI